MVSEAAVRAALDTVMDPHMNVSLPDMGMVRRVDIEEDGLVDVGLVFPCVGCPAWDLIQAELKDAVGAVEAVGHVEAVNDALSPDWANDRRRVRTASPHPGEHQ